MILSRARDGYVFLVTVLMIGVIATATAASLMLLAWAAEQNGFLVSQSAQAYEYARTCAERALGKLRFDPGYAGEQTFTFAEGRCEIRSVGGYGNENRTVCVAGYTGDGVRRLQVQVVQLYPTMVVNAWSEIDSFNFCP